MTKFLTLAALLLVATAAIAGDKPDPGDPSVGRPSDISAELFGPIRAMCAKRYPSEYEMRDYCERRQFEGIRRLRGESEQVDERRRVK